LSFGYEKEIGRRERRKRISRIKGRDYNEVYVKNKNPICKFCESWTKPSVVKAKRTLQTVCLQ
jgi:hypothetical protein